MIVSVSEKYTLLKPRTNSFKQFYENFSKRVHEFEKEHLIIDFSEKINIEIKDFLLFLNISAVHKKNGTSFVIIYKDVNIDKIPDKINVVPTFTEALDVLEMDAIERDLGF